MKLDFTKKSARDKRNQKIEDALKRLSEENGGKKPSFEAIAKESGVGPMSVWNYLMLTGKNPSFRYLRAENEHFLFIYRSGYTLHFTSSRKTKERPENSTLYLLDRFGITVYQKTFTRSGLTGAQLLESARIATVPSVLNNTLAHAKKWVIEQQEAKEAEKSRAWAKWLKEIPNV